VVLIEPDPVLTFNANAESSGKSMRMPPRSGFDIPVCCRTSLELDRSASCARVQRAARPADLDSPGTRFDRHISLANLGDGEVTTAGACVDHAAHLARPDAAAAGAAEESATSSISTLPDPVDARTSP
jgi:hypothetical protein